jgi:hypothetical protein
VGLWPRQAAHASEAGSPRLAAPPGTRPAAAGWEGGSQCSPSSGFSGDARNLEFYEKTFDFKMLATCLKIFEH